MFRLAAAVTLALLISLLGPVSARGDSPPTRAERMVTQVSSQVAELLWVKTDDYAHTGRPERAMALIRMVIQLDPGFVDAYSVLASYTQQNEEADQIYRAGLRANPDDYQLNFEYGYFYHAVWSRNPKAGIPYLRKAVDVAPDKTQKLKALHVLAHLYRYTGQNDQAIATWEQVLRLNPSDLVAERELAALRGSPPGP
jgi:Tfp pilus assembly protein PilF